MTSLSDASEPSSLPMAGSRAWRNAGLALLVSSLFMLGVFHDAAWALLHLWWTSASYGHGFLVLPIAVYVIWERRVELMAQSPRPAWWGLVVLIAAGAAGWMAAVVDVVVVRELALWLSLVGLVWLILGWRVLMMVAFSLAYLLLAVPIWDALVPILQNVTAQASVIGVRAVGVPVFIEGTYIAIPRGRFFVDDVCSGLRYVTAGMAIGALYAYFHFHTLRWRLGFFLLVLAISVVSNWVRVFIIIVAGHLWGMDHWMVHSHVTFGWFLFMGVLVLVFAVGGFMARWEPAAGPVHRASAGGPGSGKSFARVAIVASLVVMLFPAAQWSLVARGTAQQMSPLQVPTLSGEWHGPVERPTSWQPRFVGNDAEYKVAYTNGQSHAWLYSAAYLAQGQGEELVGYPNAVHDGKIWDRMDERVVDTGADGPAKVRELELRSVTGQRLLVWYWYRVAGSNTVSPLVAKILQIRALLYKQPLSGVVALALPLEDERDEVRRHLARLLAVLAQPAVGQLDNNR